MKVKVSVILITYNHERFVLEAMRSIFTQETSFSIEVIIAEDASTDCTRTIIEEYINENNLDVKLLCQPHNVGVKRNFYDAILQCEGEYIAILEGDDIWIESTKLQEQVSILDVNLDIVAVTHNCCEINQRGEITKKIAERFGYEDKSYGLCDLQEFCTPGHTSTIMFRNYNSELLDYLSYVIRLKYVPLDVAIPMFLVAKGGIWHKTNIVSAYRYYSEVNGENWTSRHNFEEDILYFYLILHDQEKISKKYRYKLDFTNQEFNYVVKILRKLKNKITFKYVITLFIILVLADKRLLLLKGIYKRRKERCDK